MSSSGFCLPRRTREARNREGQPTANPTKTKPKYVDQKFPAQSDPKKVRAPQHLSMIFPQVT